MTGASKVKVVVKIHKTLPNITIINIIQLNDPNPMKL